MKNFWSPFAKAAGDKSPYASSFANATDDKKALGDKKKLNKQCQKEKRPILALAPMAGYTDSAFRQICKEFGVDVVYSEMASVNALFFNPAKTLELLKFSKKERPYIVQLFGSTPEHFAKAVKIVEKKIKPDGIDLNFGCPVKKILKQGAGAVLMDDTTLARKIIEAVCVNTNLPVSIKIRSKAKENDALKFLDAISDLPVSAVMIHGRTLAQGFAGPVDTAIIKKAPSYFGGVILANGGINTPEDAERILSETRADGIGIARGAIGRPWIFRLTHETFDEKNINDIFKIVLRHARLVEKIKGERGIIEMRAHLCTYLNGIPGARKLRGEMVKVKNIEDIESILKNNF
jgi:tRNA-dihydrouridine synthase B